LGARKFSSIKNETPIVAGYSIYREGQFLRSSLDSVCQYVDVVCLLEGRYLDYPELPEDSTDKIVSETASRFDPQFHFTMRNPQKFVFFPVDPMAEKEKREILLKVVRPGGYLFSIEGDEIVVGDVKAGLDFVRENEQVKIFWVYVDSKGWTPKIIRIEDGLHYGITPKIVLDNEEKVVTDAIWTDSPNFGKITQFSIIDLGAKRTSERRKATQDYERLTQNCAR
jgi:hypothetical protein